jgi:3',5'-cyclic-nucleotide phosphodiesterase
MLLTPTVAFADGGFEVIVLGALGGIQEGNLSSFLIRPHGDRNAVACDAGSLVNGLKVAHEKAPSGMSKCRRARPTALSVMS